MGHQQSLLVVLSIVVVLVSIWLGIELYNSHQTNATKRQCFEEITFFKATTADYYKTSKYWGGASFGTWNWDSVNLAKHIGIGYDGSTGIETDTANYTITVSGVMVTFYADLKDPKITYDIKYEYNVATQEYTITYP